MKHIPWSEARTLKPSMHHQPKWETVRIQKEIYDLQRKDNHKKCTLKRHLMRRLTLMDVLTSTSTGTYVCLLRRIIATVLTMG